MCTTSSLTIYFFKNEKVIFYTMKKENTKEGVQLLSAHEYIIQRYMDKYWEKKRNIDQSQPKK